MKFIPSRQALRYLRSALSTPSLHPHPRHPFLVAARHFHATWPRDRIETHVLSDIGEGVKEVQIIQWFVEEGAAIEEWSPLCEVQSDKASVEITSKFTGVIKKIHFERDAVVQVGDAMLDIEVEGDEEAGEAEPQQEVQEKDDTADSQQAANGGTASAAEASETEHAESKTDEPSTPSEPPRAKGKHASLATPAVRGLLKEHNIKIDDIDGTGRDGRVLKEDVHKHLESKKTSPTSSSVPSTTSTKPAVDSKQTETPQKLSPIQSAMFKSMTNSLKIPHFLYSDSVDITTLYSMRKRLNDTRDPDSTPKLSYLPFMIKAISLALNKYPLLNARLDTSGDKPQLVMRSNHNIGVAMDTPNGLLVPVIKSVNARSVLSITEELVRLSKLGQAGKFTNEDLTGGTITISNIGSIGGEVVAPVIVEGQLAIMGIGKVKAVPVFGKDGSIQKAEMVTISWSADHRVVDGATMARMASVVQGYLEEPGSMIVDMS